MSNSVMIKSLPIIAKSLGRNMGVTVEVDAGRARTNGSVIYLPSLPLADPEVEILGLGYIIHEAGHIRYSDFTIDMSLFSAMERSLGGKMEDIRMEQCVIRDYPGAKKRLSNLVGKLVTDGFFQPVSDDENAASALAAYVLYGLRAKALGQSALDGYAEKAKNVLQSLVTPFAFTRINSVLARVTATKNECEIFVLAQELSQVLKEESERQDPPSPNQDQDDGDGDSADGSGAPQEKSDDSGDSDGAVSDDSADSDSGGDSQGDKSKPADGQDDDSNGKSQQSSGSEDQSGGDGGDDDSSVSSGLTPEELEKAQQAMKEMLEMSEGDGPKDISDALSKLIEEEVTDARTRGNYAINMTPLTLSFNVSASDHQKALDDAQAATSALRSRMTQLVQANAKAKRNTSRHGRRLNGRKIHRVKTNNPSLFQSVSRTKAVNTTVQVLLDRSGSMGKVMALANTSTLSLVAALKQIPNVTAGAAVFPSGDNSSAVGVLSRHDQRIEQTAGVFPRVVETGSTPLLPALIWAGNTLFEQKEPRKILIVITDGEPDSMDDTKETIRDLRAGGIEVYGLGIDVGSSMHDLFDGQIAIINDESDLASATFSVLEQALFAA